MNGLAAKHYVVACPLENCHDASTPLASKEAALEWKRAHLVGHTHADLVDHIAANSTDATEYERATP